MSLKFSSERCLKLLKAKYICTGCNSKLNYAMALKHSHLCKNLSENISFALDAKTKSFLLKKVEIRQRKLQIFKRFVLNSYKETEAKLKLSQIVTKINKKIQLCHLVLNKEVFSLEDLQNIEKKIVIKSLSLNIDANTDLSAACIKEIIFSTLVKMNTVIERLCYVQIYCDQNLLTNKMINPEIFLVYIDLGVLKSNHFWYIYCFSTQKIISVIYDSIFSDNICYLRNFTHLVFINTRGNVIFWNTEYNIEVFRYKIESFFRSDQDIKYFETTDCGQGIYFIYENYFYLIYLNDTHPKKINISKYSNSRIFSFSSYYQAIYFVVNRKIHNLELSKGNIYICYSLSKEDGIMYFEVSNKYEILQTFFSIKIFTDLLTNIIFEFNFKNYYGIFVFRYSSRIVFCNGNDNIRIGDDDFDFKQYSWNILNIETQEGGDYFFLDVEEMPNFKSKYQYINYPPFTNLFSIHAIEAKYDNKTNKMTEIVNVLISNMLVAFHYSPNSSFESFDSINTGTFSYYKVFDLKSGYKRKLQFSEKSSEIAIDSVNKQIIEYTHGICKIIDIPTGHYIRFFPADGFQGFHLLKTRKYFLFTNVFLIILKLNLHFKREKFLSSVLPILDQKNNKLYYISGSNLIEEDLNNSEKVEILKCINKDSKRSQLFLEENYLIYINRDFCINIYNTESREVHSTTSLPIGKIGNLSKKTRLIKTTDYFVLNSTAAYSKDLKERKILKYPENYHINFSCSKGNSLFVSFIEYHTSKYFNMIIDLDSLHTKKISFFLEYLWPPYNQDFYKYSNCINFSFFLEFLGLKIDHSVHEIPDNADNVCIKGKSYIFKIYASSLLIINHKILEYVLLPIPSNLGKLVYLKENKGILVICWSSFDMDQNNYKIFNIKNQCEIGSFNLRAYFIQNFSSFSKFKFKFFDKSNLIAIIFSNKETYLFDINASNLTLLCMSLENVYLKSERFFIFYQNAMYTELDSEDIIPNYSDFYKINVYNVEKKEFKHYFVDIKQKYLVGVSEDENKLYYYSDQGYSYLLLD